ncbi:MAG: metal-dependent transcriptional regulator [Candidatus Thermoplasmatota archaeon]|nr:metal-dependent transcriptional regulator [Candidatus Thermoplasmatota archaeon]MBS3790742.1 metal-dependent transcriptional regulator [Candidatus Thermoplasmatota archaeon]
MSDEITQIEVDEALEILWTLEEEGKRDRESFKKKLTNKEEGFSEHRRRFRHGYREKVTQRVLAILKKRGLAEVEDTDIKLTNKGKGAARVIVRRHRLAERLMVDFLDMGKEDVERPACEFEHLLDEEVTDSICTLLGHPKECPHGMPIPKGKCCSSGKKTIEPAIIPLTDLQVGESAEIAYIHTKDHPRLHKLLSYDIGPGSEVQLHQKKPVYVIKTGETDLALEEEIIEDIYVKTLD